MVVVSLYVEAYASRRPSFLHEIGSQTMRRDMASQPVFTSYKLRDIERHDFAPRFSQNLCSGVIHAESVSPAFLCSHGIGHEDFHLQGPQCG
jgi:hypothetical protein